MSHLQPILLQKWGLFYSQQTGSGGILGTPVAKMAEKMRLWMQYNMLTKEINMGLLGTLFAKMVEKTWR